MNLLIGLVILLCLVGSEFQSETPAADLSLRLLLVAAITMLVPALAFFQTWFVSRRRVDAIDHQAVIGRLTACHSAVWLAASMAVILSLNWPSVVRNNWGLGHYFLLDELLILAPILLSLVASWAVFYDVENGRFGREAGDRSDSLDGQFVHSNHLVDANGPKEEPIRRWGQILRSWFTDRFRHVWLRIQLQVLVFAIPIALAILFVDLKPYLQSLEAIEWGLVCGAFFLLSYLLVPYAMRWVWRSGSVDAAWQEVVMGELKERGLTCHELGRWNTHGRVINACILGHFWRRRILVSDRLLAEFPERESRAVVRHEAGHLGLHHAPMRIAFLLMPMVAIMIAGWVVVGTPFVVEHLSNRLGIEEVWAFTGFGLLYSVYTLVAMRWLSHRMEFEADLYASCVVRRLPNRESQSSESQSSEIELQFSSSLACDMSEALLRLGAYQLPYFDKATWLHPSIRSRIESLQSIENGRLMAERFERERKMRLAYVWVLMLAVGLLVATVLWLIG